MNRTDKLARWFFISLVLVSNVLVSNDSLLAQRREKVTPAWRVEVDLHPAFPDQVSANLQVELLYPPPESVHVAIWKESYLHAHSIKMEDWGHRLVRLAITPKETNFKAPSHVLIKVQALGFQKTTRNTGILSYQRIGGVYVASRTLDVDMKPENLPQVLNVVRLADQSEKYVNYEVTISNPGA